MKRAFPDFETDEDAERFVASADVSEYDFSEFRPVRFALNEEPVAHFDLEVPQNLLDAVRKKAAARGMSDARYIRELIERDLSYAETDG